MLVFLSRLVFKEDCPCPWPLISLLADTFIIKLWKFSKQPNPTPTTALISIKHDREQVFKVIDRPLVSFMPANLSNNRAIP